MADTDKVKSDPSSQSTSSNDDAVRVAEEPKHDGSHSDGTGKAADKAGGPQQPSKLKQAWDKVGLDFMTVSIMFKGSLPPIIGLAMYQSTAVATEYATLGYLIAIMSLLGFCIMPRGKFIQTIIMNVVAACFAAAVNLLALYCVTEARRHTTPAHHSLEAYNSSASAVCALWLFFQIYLVNVVRGARPQFQFPAIIYSIFVSVSMTYGVKFPTMAYAISFMKKLLTAFLTGFALAFGVHFVVFPTTSRTVLFKEMTGFLMLVTGTLKVQTAYMESLETIDPVAVQKQREEEAAAHAKKHSKKGGPRLGPLTTPAALKLKEVHGKLVELLTKMQGDVTPAKREFALGKLESHDLTELWKLLRMVFVPVAGLSASLDIIQRRAADADWSHDGATDVENESKHRQVENLHFLMKQLREPFAKMTADVEGAIMHVLITLELVKPPKKKEKDEESRGDLVTPGSAAFAETYKAKIDEFYRSKQKTLADWCREHDIELPSDFFESTFVRPETMKISDEAKREEHQRQLFFTLYLEYLLWRLGTAVLDVVIWADKKKADGTLKRSKLIFPGSKTLYKWLKSVFGQEDLSKESAFTAEMDAGGTESVYLGEDFARRKDPEHLPPRNTAEKIGEAIRTISAFFRSDASAFGLRVACATMTIAIICFLEASQTWFLEQRLLWAMIMVAISMSRTAGQSTFNFAMIASFVVWYIVDGKTAGALVFLWLWIFCAFYVVLKFPKLVIVAILGIVTSVLIVGYELEVRKIGVAAATSNGQPAYPTYELAPYRLACVAGGLLVAYIWTIFPYPVSETSELRKDLGATLYLLSNFYSIAHETVKSRVKATDGHANVKGTHAYNLEKARSTVLTKLLLLITTLRTNAAFSKFQLRVGGRFPREEYESLIECCARLTQNLALIGYASKTFSTSEYTDGAELSQWSADFRKLLASIAPTSHRNTTLLLLLSSGLSNGQPLPPYLEMPKPFEFTKKLESIDPDMLSIRHIAEPEYSAFAVVQICSQAINVDIVNLTEHVKTLVGEIDFTFHAVRTNNQDTTDDSSLDLDEGKGKAE